jgi:hypothetical protein
VGGLVELMGVLNVGRPRAALRVHHPILQVCGGAAAVAAARRTIRVAAGAGEALRGCGAGGAVLAVASGDVARGCDGGRESWATLEGAANSANKSGLK